MDLKDFVKSVLLDVNLGVDEARAQTSRDIHFTQGKDARTVEFDIAVSVEDKKTASGKAGVRVLQFVEAGGNAASENSRSTVSRIRFGVDISYSTKDETKAIESESAIVNSNPRRPIFSMDDVY